ncbi:hypothetical protein ACU8KH_04869 [Lachancea thermotolerans]
MKYLGTKYSTTAFCLFLTTAWKSAKLGSFIDVRTKIPLSVT